MAEWITVLDNVVLDRSVIDCAQDAGVKRYGVRSHAPFFVPGFISLHYFGGYAVKHYILMHSILLKTIECGSVSLGSADFAIPF